MGIWGNTSICKGQWKSSLKSMNFPSKYSPSPAVQTFGYWLSEGWYTWNWDTRYAITETTLGIYQFRINHKPYFSRLFHLSQPMVFSCEDVIVSGRVCLGRMFHQPSLKRRKWRGLGSRELSLENPKEITLPKTDKMKGWSSNYAFSWLLLWVSGRVSSEMIILECSLD